MYWFTLKDEISVIPSNATVYFYELYNGLKVTELGQNMLSHYSV